MFLEGTPRAGGAELPQDRVGMERPLVAHRSGGCRAPGPAEQSDCKTLPGAPGQGLSQTPGPGFRGHLTGWQPKGDLESTLRARGAPISGESDRSIFTSPRWLVQQFSAFLC